MQFYEDSELDILGALNDFDFTGFNGDTEATDEISFDNDDFDQTDDGLAGVLSTTLFGSCASFRFPTAR